MGDNLVTVVSVVGAFTLGGFFWWTLVRAQVRARELLHVERKAAIEKGLPPPPDDEAAGESSTPPVRDPDNELKMGLFWLFLGTSVILAVRIAQPASAHWAWGIILVAIGVSDLVYWLLRGRARTGVAGPVREDD
jgi:hypothetical protein